MHRADAARAQRDRAHPTGWLVRLGLIALAAGACASPSPAPAAAPVARSAGGSQGEAENRAPVKRVQPHEAPVDREGFRDPERRQKIVAFAESQRGELEKQLRALGAPGFAWGLVLDDALVLSGGAGTTRIDGGAPVSASTLFRIGSITKVFTALALLTLRDRGLLSLDEPIRRWLPEFDAVLYPSADAPLITPRHILLHRSGLPRLGNFDYTDPAHPPTERDVLGALEGVVLGSAPGLVAEYSNFGYALLGVLVARVAQQPYEAYVTQRVLEPLGMSHSAWAADGVGAAVLARPHAPRADGTLGVVPEWPPGAGSSAGGIYSSVEDMARFVSFQLAAWPASDRAESAVLARASLRESQNFQSFEGLRVTLGPEQKAWGQVTGAGFGWGVYGDCRFELVAWHNGGTEGHHAAVYLSPPHGVGVILLANADGVDLDGVARQLLERLHDGGVLSLREPVLELSAAWRRQVDAAFALGRAFDPQKYEALFAPSFRRAVPTADMQTYLEQAATELGACTIGAPIDSRHPRWIAAALECERGQRVVEAQLLSDSTLSGFWIGDRERHERRLRSRGQPHGSCG
jgi:CubicO group peptidase (beta-lactamase class C family)